MQAKVKKLETALLTVSKDSSSNDSMIKRLTEENDKYKQRIADLEDVVKFQDQNKVE